MTWLPETENGRDQPIDISEQASADWRSHKGTTRWPRQLGAPETVVVTATFPFLSVTK